jgi:hypothetical protein
LTFVELIPFNKFLLRLFPVFFKRMKLILSLTTHGNITHNFVFSSPGRSSTFTNCSAVCSYNCRPIYTYYVYGLSLFSVTHLRIKNILKNSNSRRWGLSLPGLRTLDPPLGPPKKGMDLRKKDIFSEPYDNHYNKLFRTKSLAKI